MSEPKKCDTDCCSGSTTDMNIKHLEKRIQDLELKMKTQIPRLEETIKSLEKQISSQEPVLEMLNKRVGGLEEQEKRAIKYW